MLITLLQAQLPPSNLPYLFAAFAVTWAVFFIYAFVMTRRQQELERRVQELSQPRQSPGSGPGA